MSVDQAPPDDTTDVIGVESDTPTAPGIKMGR